MQPRKIDSELPTGTPGLDMELSNPWVVWCQCNRTTWTEEDTIPIYEFNTIAGFWTVMNDIRHVNNLKNIRWIFMRKGILPKWEDPQHIRGGYCTIKLDIINHAKLFLDCLSGIIGEMFTNMLYDSFNITGVTYVNRDDYKQMRIWISHIENPIRMESLASEYVNLLFNKRKYGIKVTPFTRIQKCNEPEGKQK
jgi:hypothetical protein